MSDLVEFVRRMLDEDEATARAANAVDTESVGKWTVVETPVRMADFKATDVTVESSLDWTICGGIGSGSLAERRGLAAHIARHDPARVLAEVAAKRAIVERAAEELSANQNRMEGYEIHQNDGARCVAGDVLRHLAAPYAACEGYRSEWAP